MKDQLIGILGVFFLTFCLIALYHLIGKIGRHRKRHAADMSRAKQPGRDRPPEHDPRRATGVDDDWLLWSPETSERAGPSGLTNLSERKHSWLRRESR